MENYLNVIIVITLLDMFTNNKELVKVFNYIRKYCND